MSVGGIHSSFASDQFSSIAATNTLKYTRTQQLAEGAASSSLDVPSDGATFQQAGSSSASSTSNALTAVQKAYQSLQQADTTTAPKPVGPSQWSGGPVRSRGVTTDPIQTHEPMPPVFKSPTNLPIPTQFHDPLDPPPQGTTTSVIA